MISKERIPFFLPLSIVSNIGACMMSINMFKLAAWDLRRILHASPSLGAVFEMPRFIRSGPLENMGLKLTGRRKQTV